MSCEYVNTLADRPQTPTGQPIQPQWTHFQRDEAILRALLPLNQKFLIQTLNHFADDYGHCTVGVDRLAAICGVEPRTVKGWLAALAAAGVITRTARPGRQTTVTTILVDGLLAIAGDAARAMDMTPMPTTASDRPRGRVVPMTRRGDRQITSKRFRGDPPRHVGVIQGSPKQLKNRQAPLLGRACSDPTPDPAPAPLPPPADPAAYTALVYARMAGGAS
jgi:hypothetical protein